MLVLAGLVGRRRGPAARPARPRSGRSITAPSTTTCSRRRPCCPGRTRSPSRAGSRCSASGRSRPRGGSRGWSAARSRRPRPGSSRPCRPPGSTSLDVHLEPEPDPARLGARVRRGADGACAAGTRAGGCCRRVGAMVDDAVPRPGRGRRAAARGRVARPTSAGGGGAASAVGPRSRAGAGRARDHRGGLPAAPRLRARARLRGDARDPRLPRGWRQRRRERRPRPDRDRRPAVDHVAVARG